MTSLSIGDVISASFDDSCTSKNIFRTIHSKENPYTLITNKLLRDETIRHSDRGLMAQLLSWSDYHRLCIKALVKRSVEGRDAIRGMIDRLITAGYIKMIKIKGQDGRFDKVVYQIFEESTGVVVSELDLNGIVNNDGCEESPQLDLFGFENGDAEVKNDNLTTNGKAVNGKHEPNNNYDLRNNLNNNNAPSNFVEKPENKETLLNKWSLDIQNPELVARLGISGLNTLVTDQQTLNRFLIDFNQQHEKYKHLSESQRLKNFIAYLVRVKYTPVEYNKHLARLKALGFDVNFPKKQQRTPKSVPKQLNQDSVNPFAEVKSEAFEVPELNFSDF